MGEGGGSRYDVDVHGVVRRPAVGAAGFLAHRLARPFEHELIGARIATLRHVIDVVRARDRHGAVLRLLVQRRPRRTSDVARYAPTTRPHGDAAALTRMDGHVGVGVGTEHGREWVDVAVRGESRRSGGSENGGEAERAKRHRDTLVRKRSPLAF